VVTTLIQQRIALGLCPCGIRPPIPGRRKCEECRDRDTKNKRNRREYRKANDLCTECSSHEILIPEDACICEPCWFKGIARKNLGQTKLWEPIREIWYQQDGICTYEGYKLRLGLNACLDHKSPVSRFPLLKTYLPNLHWIDKKINMLKSNRTHEEFLAYIASIYHNCCDKGTQPLGLPSLIY
jgi:hypothetical protein